MAEGHSNAVLALHEEGYQLADSQQELIPFQRHVIMVALREQQEEAEKQQGGGMGGGMGGGQAHNPLAQPNGGSTISGDTVTYVNNHEFDDEDED